MTIQEQIAKLEKEVNWIEFEFQGKKYKISDNLGEFDWREAVKKCRELGGKLPPRWLLCAIADEPELVDIKKSFGTGYFWSATEYSETNARYVYFSSGYTGNSNKTSETYVRCVIDI